MIMSALMIEMCILVFNLTLEKKELVSERSKRDAVAAVNVTLSATEHKLWRPMLRNRPWSPSYSGLAPSVKAFQLMVPIV